MVTKIYKVVIVDEHGNDNAVAIQELCGDIPCNTISVYEVEN